MKLGLGGLGPFPLIENENVEKSEKESKRVKKSQNVKDGKMQMKAKFHLHLGKGSEVRHFWEHVQEPLSPSNQWLDGIVVE